MCIHLKEIYGTIELRQLTADELNAISDIHAYEIEVKKNLELNDTNALLTSLDESPLKIQAIVPLEEQTPAAIRRSTAKLRRAVPAAGNLFLFIRFCFLHIKYRDILAANVAQSIAPGQGEMLLQLAQLDNLSERQSVNTSTSSNASIDEQYLSYLVRMYQA